jgi:sulfur carrier protein ThiS
MEVTVKFRGTLGLNMPEYDPVKGIRVELPPGATVQDLFKCLNIDDPQKIIVTMDYRIRKAKDPLPQGADLIIFQLVSGG